MDVFRHAGTMRCIRKGLKMSENTSPSSVFSDASLKTLTRTPPSGLAFWWPEQTEASWVFGHHCPVQVEAAEELLELLHLVSDAGGQVTGRQAACAALSGDVAYPLPCTAGV